MKRLCVVVLATAAIAALAAPAAKAQQVTVFTCAALEARYPAPTCGKWSIPSCDWGGMSTCKLSGKGPWTRYSSRCTAWHCHYIGPR